MNEQKKFDWQRLVNALTDEEQAFNFPVKYPAIDFDRQTKQMFYVTASILAVGLIAAAAISKK